MSLGLVVANPLGANALDFFIRQFVGDNCDGLRVARQAHHASTNRSAFRFAFGSFTAISTAASSEGIRPLVRQRPTIPRPTSWGPGAVGVTSRPSNSLERPSNSAGHHGGHQLRPRGWRRRCRDHHVHFARVAVGVHHRDDRDAQLAGFLHGDVFFLVSMTKMAPGNLGGS